MCAARLRVPCQKNKALSIYSMHSYTQEQWEQKQLCPKVPSRNQRTHGLGLLRAPCQAPIQIRARPADTTTATEAGLTSISFVLPRRVWRLQHIIQWTTQYQTELSLIRKDTYDTELILKRKAPTTKGGASAL